MPRALLSVPGTWHLFCFVSKSRQSWSYSSHPMLSVPVRPLLCFISVYPSTFLCPAPAPLPTIPVCFSAYPLAHMYSCKNVLLFCEHIFLNCINDSVLSPLLFLFFSAGLNFKAPFMLPWCTSNLLHLAAAYSSMLGIPYILPAHFPNDKQ